MRPASVQEARDLDLTTTDLLIVGSPTRGFRPTPHVSSLGARSSWAVPSRRKPQKEGLRLTSTRHRCEVIDYRNDFLPPGLSIGRQRDMNDGWSSGPGAHCGQTVATVDDQLKVSTRSRINLRIEGLTSSASLLAGRPGGNSSLSAASPTRWTRLSMALSALIIAAPIVIWSRLLSIGACFGWAGRSLAGLPLGIGAGRS